MNHYFTHLRQISVGISTMERLMEELSRWEYENQYIIIDWSFTDPMSGLGLGRKKREAIVLNNGLQGLSELDEDTINDMLESSNIYFTDGLTIDEDEPDSTGCDGEMPDEEHSTEQVTEILRALFGVQDNNSEDIDFKVWVTDLNPDVPEYYYKVSIKNSEATFKEVYDVL